MGNKFIDTIKKISFKNGFVYFLILQIGTLLIAFFLSIFINIPINMIFDIGLYRNIAYIISYFIVESVVKFIIFFAFFKNDRNLTFKAFCLNYIFTFALRYILSLIFSFALYVAGATTSLLGITLTEAFILKNEVNVTMQHVPKALYTLIFVLIEGIAILIAFSANKLAQYRKEKAKKELYKEKA
ncbi:MAG: hypothetical protein IJ398_01950 [Clostridia bacterium]|nr:hypothetical protein [Clostridia bacterium]